MPDNPLVQFLLLFRDIPVADQAMINNAFTLTQYKEGAWLQKTDKISRHLFFICDGILRIVVHSDKGTPITYFFLKENQFCTILNSFNNEIITPEGIQAACDTKVLSISKTELLTLYQQLPYMKTLIDDITQQALLDKIQLKNSYLGLDSTKRYQLFLMQQPEIALRVPLSDIASYLGITQQSLSRIRRNLQQH